jgi:hypothetical protein
VITTNTTITQQAICHVGKHFKVTSVIHWLLPPFNNRLTKVSKVFKMIIRSLSFKNWFKANLKEYAEDIASHGADAGYPYITYTVDTVKIFDKFADRIWEMAVEDAETLGYPNVAAMIAEFGRSDMLSSIDSFKNLMVWFACEKLAHQLTND